MKYANLYACFRFWRIYVKRITQKEAVDTSLEEVMTGSKYATDNYYFDIKGIEKNRK